MLNSTSLFCTRFLTFTPTWQGVLIVGETGTGKTSLALAIAAEASVPVVRVKAEQLEAGLWVGQGASNIRELFQTARDLVLSDTNFLSPPKINWDLP